MSFFFANLYKTAFAQKIILGGAFVGICAIFAPWHTLGSALIGMEHTFSGLNDQNFIIGFLVLGFLSLALLLILLPLFGIRLPRLPLQISKLIIFLGSESTFLIVILMIMHTTALTRAVNYNLRWGIYLTLFSALVVAFGGILDLQKNTAKIITSNSHLGRLPNYSSGSKLNTTEVQQKTREDARMRLDL